MSDSPFQSLVIFFEQNQLSFHSFNHPPVYTCEQVRKLNLNIPGVELKNLFLRDRKGARHFLLAVPAEKNVDLKALGRSLDIPGLGLASAERLKKYLGLEPGAVTLLAVFNDHESKIEVLIDRDIQKAGAFQCHPLVNTSTWVVGRADLERFFELTGHKPAVVDVPAREWPGA